MVKPDSPKFTGPLRVDGDVCIRAAVFAADGGESKEAATMVRFLSPYPAQEPGRVEPGLVWERTPIKDRHHPNPVTPPPRPFAGFGKEKPVKVEVPGIDRLVGWLRVPRAGVYYFTLRSERQIKHELQIGGEGGPAVSFCRPVALEQGYHRVVITDGLWGNVRRTPFDLPPQWDGPGVSGVISDEAFFRDAGALK